MFNSPFALENHFWKQIVEWQELDERLNPIFYKRPMTGMDTYSIALAMRNRDLTHGELAAKYGSF